MFSLSGGMESDIWYRGKKYRLELSFDNVLRLFELWRDGLFSHREKLDLSLSMLAGEFYGIGVKEKEELLRMICDEFIMPGPKGGSGERYFDFRQDAAYIYASFLSEYGIDLVEQMGRLDWRKFMALFQGLGDRSKIRRVMAIRAKRIPQPNKHNAEEIRALKELKAAYALELSQAEIELGFDKGIERLGNYLEGMGR